MPEGQIGTEGEEGPGTDGGTGGGPGPSGKEIEVLAPPGAEADEARTGGCAEVIGFAREQLKTERIRAQSAEQAVQALQQRLGEVESALAQAREALDAAERRHQVDLMLIESGTVDLESSRLLTELALQRMSERDVALAVGELRRRKPFLFRSRAAGARGSAAMSPAAPAPDPAEQSAQEASRTGDRGALMRYLRARRGG